MGEEKNEQSYTSLYEGARCGEGHELEFISEGFALCKSELGYWWAWSIGLAYDFIPSKIIGRDGNSIVAYVQNALGSDSRDEAIAIIDKVMQAMREQPYDEERERQRLIPV